MEKLKFIIEKKVLFGIMIQITKVLKRSNGNKRHQIGEFTITKNKLSINVPGATFDIKIISEGGAKFTTNLILFSRAINVFTDNILEFTLYNNQLSCSSFRLDVVAIFIKDDRVLRKIDLPVNYRKSDIVRLLNGKYTHEELAFNKLDDIVDNVISDLRDKTLKIANVLEPYGIKYDVIDVFIKRQLELLDNESLDVNIEKSIYDA
jgi:hypothetical protein